VNTRRPFSSWRSSATPNRELRLAADQFTGNDHRVLAHLLRAGEIDPFGIQNGPSIVNVRYETRPPGSGGKQPFCAVGPCYV
jgi:hypothetical protein